MAFPQKTRKWQSKELWLIASPLFLGITLLGLGWGKTLFYKRFPRTVGEAPDTVTAIAFSSDSKTVATAGGRFFHSGEIRLWDVASGQTRRIIHTGAILSLAFSPDGSLLASGAGAGDGTVKLWNPRTGQLLRTISEKDEVWSLTFSPDGKFLVTNEGRLMLWNTQRGTLVRRFNLPNREESVLAYAPDGNTIAGISETKLIDLPRPHEVDKSRFVGGEVLLWDVKSGKLRRTLPGDNTEAVAFAPAGNRLITLRFIRNRPYDAGIVGSILTSFDPATGKIQWTQQGQGSDWFIGPPVYSPDGKLLATECQGNRIDLWDAATGHLLRTLKPLPFSRKSDLWFPNSPLAFSRDGKMIASHNDKSVLLWQLSP